jgi:hypothetical protein
VGERYLGRALANARRARRVLRDPPCVVHGPARLDDREFNAVSRGRASQRFTDERRVVSSLKPARGGLADKHQLRVRMIRVDGRIESISMYSGSLRGMRQRPSPGAIVLSSRGNSAVFDK